MTSREQLRAAVRELDPDGLETALAAGTAVLVDVRERPEIALGLIAGATVMPLSEFAPERIAVPAGATVVFICAAGVRSVLASELAQAAGLPYDTHLAGGLRAWVLAGKPIVRS